jgi:hypothetical protein
LHPLRARKRLECPGVMGKLQLRDRLIHERAKQLGIPEPSDAEVETRARAELRAAAQKAIAALEPMTLKDLSEAGAEFEEVESRGGFYDLARGLVEKGYALEGCILLLATWNAARFSKVHFEIDALRNALTDLRDDFSALAGYSIQTVDLEVHRNRIEAMFNRLAAIKGVEYTGASKLLHLMLPELFVAWDSYIRGDANERFYSGLPCVISKKWCLVRYDQIGRGYVDFLLDMQGRVRGLAYAKGSKTLPKNLDEWNYVQVTIRIQVLEKAEAELRKAR